MLTLYQAEWCPFSSAVRELLTELGIDYVARQVEPFPEQRDALRSRSGGDTIPTLETEDGTFHQGTRAIFRYLETLEPGPHAAEHRQRFLDHRDARISDAPGQLVERAELRAPAPPDDWREREAEPRDNPDESRYELWLGDRMVGLAAYGLRDGAMIFTHTEIDAACEGHGLGTKLVEFAVSDAERRGLEIVPLCPFVRRHLGRRKSVGAR